MYNSPIDIIYGQMETQLEDNILRAVQKYGIDVDKEELIRALRYDRNQYEKGYVDAMQHCNMYNKKYKLEKIEEFGRHNPLYEDMNGNTCYLVYFNPGERGWFLYESGIPYDCPHRVHTSIVEDVEYTDGQVIVTTQNTRFTFTPI